MSWKNEENEGHKVPLEADDLLALLQGRGGP
jgi:hypothetical protein